MDNSGVNARSVRKTIVNLKRNTRKLEKAKKRYENMSGTRAERRAKQVMLRRIQAVLYDEKQRLAELEKAAAAQEAADRAEADALKRQKEANMAAEASRKAANAAAVKSAKIQARVSRKAAQNSNANALLATLLNKSRSNQEAEFNIAGLGKAALNGALSRLPKEEEPATPSPTQLSNLKKKAAALTNAANAVAASDPELGLSPRTHAELNMLSAKLDRTHLASENWGGESPSYGSNGKGTPPNRSYAKGLARGYEGPDVEEYP